MKNYISFLLLAFTFFGFSQKENDSIYFPQEQLIHPDCENEVDKNSCLKEIFDSKVLKILQKYTTKKQLKKDTLKVNIRFSVDANGRIDDGLKYITTNEKNIKKKATKNLESIFAEMPVLKVVNKKPEIYNAFHLLHLSYVKTPLEGENILKPIDTQSQYTGGYIEEMPIYPGCEQVPKNEQRQCFNAGMQQHLAKNFRYPKEAQKRKIQGRVSIMFHIDEEGNVADIRTRGPHEMLEKEAIRIIKLFPNCEPGKINGKAKRIPYAVPLTFKLR